MKGPERSPLRVEPACFQCALDGRISGVNLRCKASDSAAACVIHQSIQQCPAHAPVSPRIFDEEFHEVHGLSTVFRTPLVACISKAADASVVLGDENDAQLRRLKYSFIDTLSVSRRCARVPLMEQFFSKFAQARNVFSTSGPNLNCRCL